MPTYTVRLHSGDQHTVVAEDVQSTELAVKFLNGKKAQAQVVAYFSQRSVESIIQVQTQE